MYKTLTSQLRPCALVLALGGGLFIQSVFAQQTNWTHFRGNNLDGISADVLSPVAWNDSTNILWVKDIQGKGWSSPVVYGEQVWITSAAEDGSQLSAVCLDFNSGNQVYNLPLFQPDTVFGKHTINTYATPTPCIEAGYVYIHFGTYGTACISTADGKTIWERTDLKCDHVQGPGSSPIIYKNLLILHIDGVDVQYLIALDKATGKTVWKTERPAEVYATLAAIGKKAYVTPIIIRVDGRDLLISNGSAVCIAYDPETGEEIWRVIQGTDSTIAMPIFENGIVYFYPGFIADGSGGNYTELLAVNPVGKGDITQSNVIWRFKSPVLQLLTPLIKDGLIYTVDTRNTLYCLDAKTGNVVYSKKLKQKYNASPVFANGNVYFTSVRAETMVIKAGRQLEILAENMLHGEVYATPAFVRNSILMRTDGQLYRIGGGTR